jgi:hypothetical protein
VPLLPRDQILEQTDLAALADELLGSRRGRGPSATWPCPSPHHGPQTGRTPPVSIFTATAGYQRWHCHACGAGGTAIDLLLETTSLTIRQALAHLAQRTGLHYPRPLRSLDVPRRSRNAPEPRPRPAAFARQALRDHMQRCQEVLWSPAGRPMLDYLHARGLHDQILRANQVGADPGPRHLTRARGLPARGPAVIFPVLDDHGAIYLQARYLNPEVAAGRKYENPAAWVATNPRWACVHTAGARQPGPLWICEGLPDALSMAQHNAPAVALLGVGLADHHLARYLLREHPHQRIVIGFDADSRGRAAARTLAAEVRRTGQDFIQQIKLPTHIEDLNDWMRRAPRTLQSYVTSVQTARGITPHDLVQTLALDG